MGKQQELLTCECSALLRDFYLGALGNQTAEGLQLLPTILQQYKIWSVLTSRRIFCLLISLALKDTTTNQLIRRVIKHN